MTTTVVQWDRLRQDVETARTIDELKDIRDKAEALRQYAKKQKESLEIQNKMAEITLRCTRRMGEMLKERQMNEGNRIASNREVRRSHDGTAKASNGEVKLADIGITKDEWPSDF